MRINHNLSALNAWKNLVTNDDGQNKTLEKLSSGLRIGRAADDAAGLSISEKMRGQIKGLNQASRNAQDGISLLQTAEGALGETHSILQRMRELAVQSASDTVTDKDRVEIQKEVDALAVEITRIADTTEFNTQKLLNGDYSSKIIHIGANASQSLTVNISATASTNLSVGGAVAAQDLFDHQVTGSMTMSMTGTRNQTDTTRIRVTVDGTATNKTLAEYDASTGTWTDKETVAVGNNFAAWEGVTISTLAHTANSVTESYIMGSASGIHVESQWGANQSISVINTAINTVSSERSKLGAIQNRLDHTIANLATSSENLTAAESRIRDVDIAVEMMSFTKYQILSQASTAMLAQANQKPQAVLQLLR
ncbi:MAG: flagellin [Clostridia bacterium]|nr:flagellin [Clostridia bacterium]